MAFVGTLSGSNRTSRTAVTGSLVIADRPAASFPSLPSDAILFVSGNMGGGSKAVIGGDLVVSGTISTAGFRSGSIYTYRSVTSDSTMSSIDSIIGCNHTALLTIKLPAAADCVSGQFFIVKDESGAAATYNIIVSKSLGSTDTIDGKDAYTLNTNSAAITLYRGGTGKFFIT